jgi:hypothetical protein
MKVPELLTALALGELNNLSMGVTDAIDPSKIPKVIQSINDGLTRLHTKFVLKEKNLILEMKEGVTFYQFKKRFAYSQYDSNNPPSTWNMPYIIDLSKEPFEEDVIKVMSVYDQLGNKLPINDLEKPNSVFTPQAEVIQVPNIVPVQMLSVEYQAKPVLIPTTEYEDIDVDLPDFLLITLRYFVGSEIYSQMNTQENIMKGQEYLAKFDRNCQEAIDMDLVSSSSSTTNTRFEKRGWV